MRKFNSYIGSYYNKIITKANSNNLLSIILNSNRKINILSNNNHLKQDFKTSEQENKNNLKLGNQYKELHAIENSKNFLLTRTVSKSFATKDTRIKKPDSISNEHAKLDNDSNKNSNIPKDLKRKTNNNNLTSNKVQEKSNNKKESNFEFNSKSKKYNPELIDKKTNLFNLTEKLPEKVQYYIKLGRYDRPIGYLLLFYPCAWGLTLATPFLDYIYFYHICLFFSGSVLMRSAGCIINDMWDRNIDKLVERSKTRPLAAGHLSMKEAAGFLAIHLALSLVILLKLPTYSILAGLSIVPIIVIYPFMKRVTYFPQLILGLAFNSGIIVGYAALEGLVNYDIMIPFYIAGVLWTLIYDTIYAHMDKFDDAKINVKSTALYFGNNTRRVLYFLNLLMVLSFFIGLNRYKKRHDFDTVDSEKKEEIKIENETSIRKIEVNDIVYDIKNNESEFDIKNFTFFKWDLSEIIMIAAFLYQNNLIKKTKFNDPLSCLKTFKRNSIFGFIVFGSCLSKVLKRDDVRVKQQDK
jgi:4-hydroxybenzoate polyprenyltransferase